MQNSYWKKKKKKPILWSIKLLTVEYGTNSKIKVMWMKKKSYISILM